MSRTAPSSSPDPAPGRAAWPRPVRPRLPGWLAYRLQRTLAPNAGYRWLVGVLTRSRVAHRAFTSTERAAKGAALGCRMCGQCTLPVTGYACPETCPKKLRNGPCGGRWMAEVRDLGLDQRCRILAGVGPVRSLRALDRMRTGVPGVYIPGEVDRRLRAVPPGQVGDEGTRICAEIIEQVRDVPGVSGVHVMAPGHEPGIPGILERAGLARRDPAAPVPTLGGQRAH